LTLATDRAEYALDTATARTTVQLTVLNGGPSPVYLAGCPEVPGLLVDRYEAGAWQEAFQINTACLAIYGTVYRSLGAGDTLIVRLNWWAPGKFRLHLYYGLARQQEYERLLTGPSFVVHQSGAP